MVAATPEAFSLEAFEPMMPGTHAVSQMGHNMTEMAANQTDLEGTSLFSFVCEDYNPDGPCNRAFDKNRAVTGRARIPDFADRSATQWYPFSLKKATVAQQI